MNTETINIDKTQQTKGRLIFLALAIFFVVPIVVVLAMLKFHWHPSGQSYGELIRPAKLIVMPPLLKRHDGVAVDNLWRDKWSMVYVARGCDSLCATRLYDMRQIYVSLYKDMLRTQRVLITQQTDLSEIKKNYPDMVIINQPESAVASLFASFNLENKNALEAEGLYFVDPRGYLVMRYPLAQKAEYIRKDLVRLLRYSWAG